ncbi:peptidoglycan recognition protein family protein [Alkaliphilus sp. MSJ-5]|uniref:Peptidoglycan recognition protein family protein n=1 Tax=Alkaliphilus flagellatus TaxID=2841507 RepID=A0ABS6G0L4_9FIRM|nr:peptidoglycan recognition family protein [Alkaliphilus flagellatus]MBU5675884.1 peptidoglycan recognition protein family protein [Alkaliphilus flagellatus]
MSMIVQPKPSMVSRSGWGATAVDLSKTNNLKNPAYIIVHHAGDANDAIVKAYPDEKAAMRRYQQIHIGQGWGDIGYHYCIGINGTILEGRTDTKEGIHAPGYNYRSIAVMLHGNYDIRSFTSTQQNKLIDILAWLCYKNNISPSNILGHKDVTATTCPGSGIYSKLSSIRGLVMDRVYPQPQQ